MEFFNNVNENNISDLFSTLDINDNIVYLFVNVSHIWKNMSNIKKSGVLLYSLLMYNENKLIINSKYSRHYYVKNKENSNILIEDEKKYSKFTVKFIYLKFTNIESKWFNWEQSIYVLDKVKYKDYLFENEKIKNSKIEICEGNKVKFKLSCSAVLRNIISNIMKIYQMKEKNNIL
jgi:hypothetical protein